MVAFSSKTMAQHPALGGGTGDSLNPYQITDTSHLRILADYVNAGNGNNTNGVYYKLMNDLDLSAYNNWKPIGDIMVGGEFRGNFNGNGKAVKNLKINRPTERFIGLFSSTYKANIENLGVENCNVTGREGVGGLVGVVDVSTIINCYVTGSVNGDNDVGGLVGYCRSSPISNCYTTGNVTGSKENVGGLVGYNNYDALISNCYATGNVTGSDVNVGGLSGNNGGTISYCYATGSVTGSNANVGGLAGSNSGTLSNCYVTGSVTGSNECVGGLVGINNVNAIITNCYAAGSVSGRRDVGGFVGRNNGTISYCYATGSVNGDERNVGGLAGAQYGNMQNCVAANSSVKSTSNTTSINRIAGIANESYCHNNYAFNDMVVGNSNGAVPVTDDLNGKAGMGKDMVTLKTLAFYYAIDNWYQTAWDINSATSVWKICNGESLPFLRWQGIACDGETGITAISQNTMLQVYPNPTKSELRIENGDLKIENIQVFDIVGKLVSSFTVSSQSQEIVVNISQLADGLYFLKIGNRTVKIVKN
jgi:hypothetical protein